MHNMVNIYLNAAHFCLDHGDGKAAQSMLKLALAEANRVGLPALSRKIMAALSYARRVQS